MQFKKHRRFEKSFRKLSPKLQLKTTEVLKIFAEDRYNSRLNNHALKWIFSWFRSINLTWDYRIIYRQFWDEMTIAMIESDNEKIGFWFSEKYHK